MRIGIDIMGGDKDPVELVTGAFSAVKELQGCATLILYVTADARAAIEAYNSSDTPCIDYQTMQFVIVSDFIRQDEEPLYAARRRSQSSMITALRHLRDGIIDALVSIGSTGALIAGSALLLPPLLGVEKPGLLAEVPTQNGSVAVVDVGGNLTCSAENIVQFAGVGVAYQKVVKKVGKPIVGLLNIGSEALKGTPLLRQAYMRLSEMAREGGEGCAPAPFIFLGNIEGRDVFHGHVDVLVTEGFSGNIFLKTAEGTAYFIIEALRKQLQEQQQQLPLLAEWYRTFSYVEYPGALVCGVAALVVKSHGSASTLSLYHAILGAARWRRLGLIEKLSYLYQQKGT